MHCMLSMYIRSSGPCEAIQILADTTYAAKKGVSSRSQEENPGRVGIPEDFHTQADQGGERRIS